MAYVLLIPRLSLRRSVRRQCSRLFNAHAGSRLTLRRHFSFASAFVLIGSHACIIRLRLPLPVRPPPLVACAAFGFACRFRFARLLLNMASSAALEHCAPQRYQRCTDHHGPHAHWHAYQYQQYAQSNQRSRQQSYWRAPRWTARPRAHPREYRSGRAPPRMRRISAGRARTFARWPAASAVRPVCTRIAAHSGVTSGRTRAARRTPMHDRL